jgi:hypothetical protein
VLTWVAPHMGMLSAAFWDSIMTRAIMERCARSTLLSFYSWNLSLLCV